ncbi:hypothetical protein PRIPAC_74381 [Pristionchus pacificus]|uniref:Metallopeptidase n=1 Tax=Pristionchus pacificus TaxID=54126 RepID=A0A2A6B5F3_PRIPA|nr:hypothetical protein PRIPAC_74381 [Pristionchus pacificus]|eukprot:PDM61104.1 metallopeptidase [Pristionchus pacificus]
MRFIIFVLALLSPANGKPLTKHAALDYLQTFGYLQPDRLTADGSSEEEIDTEIKQETAVRNFQSMAGLLQTGELDDATLEKMSHPRCGVPDFAALSYNSDYDEDTRIKWSKNYITYSIQNYWPGLSEDEIRKVMWDAFQVWERVVPLKFAEEYPGHGDIKIKFGRKEHGGCSSFDGKGGALAHAFFPETGMLHFDSDENWIRMKDGVVSSDFSQTDFFSVAIHEIGHVIGLYLYFTFHN